MKTHLGWHFPDHDEFFSGRAKPYPSTRYQQVVLNQAFTYVKHFECAIDIGANIGLQSVRLSEKFKDVHSFEPVSTNYECLVKNTGQLNNVHSYKTALGNTVGTVVIGLSEDLKNHCGAFSIEKFQENSVITENVKIDTLDSFNLVPSLIKIDVEGYESKVLEGAVKTIEKCQPVLILEHTVKTVQKLMPILNHLNYVCVFAHEKDKIWIHNENNINRT